MTYAGVLKYAQRVATSSRTSDNHIQPKAGLVVVIRDMTVAKAIEIIKMTPDKVIIIDNAFNSDDVKLSVMQQFKDAKVTVRCI